MHICYKNILYIYYLYILDNIYYMYIQIYSMEWSITAEIRRNDF